MKTYFNTPFWLLTLATALLLALVGNDVYALRQAVLAAKQVAVVVTGHPLWI